MYLCIVPCLDFDLVLALESNFRGAILDLDPKKNPLIKRTIDHRPSVKGFRLTYQDKPNTRVLANRKG